MTVINRVDRFARCARQAYHQSVADKLTDRLRFHWLVVCHMYVTYAVWQIGNALVLRSCDELPVNTLPDWHINCSHMYDTVTLVDIQFKCPSLRLQILDWLKYGIGMTRWHIFTCGLNAVVVIFNYYPTKIMIMVVTQLQPDVWQGDICWHTT